MAKALRKALADQQIDMPHAACLEIVARQLGFRDWNVLRARNQEEPCVSFSVVVEHGREREAASFYQTAFAAREIDAYHVRGELLSVILRLGDRNIIVTGASPKFEAEPWRAGGPFYPKANGFVCAVFHLEVADPATVLNAAIAAGATVRNALERSVEGTLIGGVFDPFGHIWQISERWLAGVSKTA